MKKVHFLISFIFTITLFVGTINAQIYRGTGGATQLQPNSPATNLNIGIDNNAPLLKLHLKTSSTNDGIMIEQTGSTIASLNLKAITGRRWALHSTGTGNTEGAGNFGIYDYGGTGFTTGGYRFFLQGTTGNIGIGTTAPSAQLHSTGSVRFQGLATNTTNTNILTADANGNLAYRSASSLIPAAGWSLTGNTLASSSTFLGTLNAFPLNIATVQAQPINFGTASTQRMIIDATGKVGIGTATPSAGLHLVGGSNTGMIPPSIKLDRNDGTNQGGLLTIGISGNGFTQGLGGGSAYFKLTDPYGNSANSDMGFSTNGVAPQLVIKHNGQIVIGDIDPNTCPTALTNSHKVVVNGSLISTGMKVANYCSANWADYVFTDDYKLKTLSETESYIKENKHLPNVPSSQEIEENGLDIAEMQAKQMEKIEEITLHLIAMDKKIQALEKENAELRKSLSSPVKN